MQTFQFKITPAAAAKGPRAEGNISDSGSDAGAGLSRLQCSRHPAGNRVGRGEMAPGVWGAPGAEPLGAKAAGLPPGPQEGPGRAGSDEDRASHEKGREDSGGTEKDNGGGGKVVFTPKPDPWGGGARPQEAKAIKSVVPASFCRKRVVFTPTPNPILRNG